MINPSSQPVPQCPTWPDATRTQERLLQEIWRLQRKTGWSFCSQRHLAAQVGVTDRQVRRVIQECRELGWLRQRSQGRGRALNLRASPPAAQALLGQGQPRTFMSGGVGHECPTRGGHRCPPNSINLMKLGGHSSAARRPASPQPTLYERNLVNPWQERIRLVNAHRLPADAPLAKAIEESFTGEMWRFVLHEGLARTVVAARADGGRLEMHLAIEGSTDGTELVRVNAAMVGGLQIWNQ